MLNILEILDHNFKLQGFQVNRFVNLPEEDKSILQEDGYARPRIKNSCWSNIAIIIRFIQNVHPFDSQSETLDDAKFSNF